jgi:transcription elongation GreA/GreB family factor
MREEFEKLAAAGKIEGRHIDALVQLTDSGFCMHRSWGFGRIKTVDTVFARFTIDFPGKPGHTMDLAFAADSLKPIPKDHILARKSADIEGLRQLAATNHLELVKVVLNSFGGHATVDQIQQALVPDVIRDDWKKWWEAAKRELKKDGHFQVPLKKTEPVVYQVKEVSLQERLIGEFRAAKGLKAHVAVATEILKNGGDLGDKQAAAREIISTLNGEIGSYQRTQTPVALEGIFIRDDIREMAGTPPGEGEVTAKAIWAQDSKLAPLMEALPAIKHRRAVESFKDANPDRWADVLRMTLNSVNAKLCKEFVTLLAENGRMPELKETLARLISQHLASSELLLWLAKERTDTFADILGPEVFRAMLTAMERDQFNEKRSNRLREYILDDQELLPELTAAAELEVIKDLTRALQLSPVFDDMDKRSLLARIVKSHPAVQSLISGGETKQDTTLIVSWDSLERRRQEYDELVHKKMPANREEIAIARSYGDLRENHEYKAAKEMQKQLVRAKGDMENQLQRARGTDFSNVRADVASIGTIVHTTNITTNQRETFTILGAWDSDPDKGVVSYLSPMAQALLNRKIGDEVEFEIHGARHQHRIESIEAFKPTAGAATPEQAAATPQTQS